METLGWAGAGEGISRAVAQEGQWEECLGEGRIE